MEAWGRFVDIDGQMIPAWKVSRTAPDDILSFDGRRRDA
jgi:hypothetical protein